MVIFCLLNEGVSHFVDRLDSFCTYLLSILDSIDNICNIYMSHFFNLHYVATSLRSLLSNTGVFCLFSRSFRGAKKPDFDCIYTRPILHISSSVRFAKFS